MPSSFPYSSAITLFGCEPRASVCPCARCVDAKMSPSSIAWQTPTATASWPIATCRKPGSSPARKRSSTRSSKRRISSISRRKSRRRSSFSARFFSTLAKAPAVYGFGNEPRRPVAHPPGWPPGGLDPGCGAARTACRGTTHPRLCVARPRAAVPRRPEHVAVLVCARRKRTQPGRDRAAAEAPRRPAHRRHAWRSWIRGGSCAHRTRTSIARRAVGRTACRPARRLERPARGDQSRVERLRRAGGGAAHPDEPAACRDVDDAALSQRAPRRLRRLARDGTALLRALRRGEHPRHDGSAARIERHASRVDSGAGVDHGRTDRLMADPVSWLMIEKGWDVVDAAGDRVGKVDEVLGDTEADIWDGLTVSGEYVAAERVSSIVDGRITLA